MGGIKRTALDKVVSDLIREAADWRCERCKTHYPPEKRRGLECSHYYGRAGKSTRYFPDNCDALCTGCHFHLGGARDEYTALKKAKLGDVCFDELVLRAKKPRKYSKADLDEMKEHYRAQLRYLERLRKEGRTGVLPVVSFD